MSQKTNISEATPENVWAILREIAARQAETDRILTEKFAANALQMAENDRILTEKFATTERVLTEMFAATARQMAETDYHISRLEKQIGGVSNSYGSFAEEYFYNSLKKGDRNFFGEKFDKLIKSEIMQDENNKTRGELDLILVNGKSVAIIEVKFKVRVKHVEQVTKKVKPFRKKFPEYQNHKVFLGLASMVFDDGIQDKCIENGIAVFLQLGDTFVIHDENLKTF